MSYTDTIQTIQYLSGTATFYVVRSSAINAVPTFASMTPSWPIVERIDVVAGDYEIPELEFTVEDETTGYWKQVLSGETVEVIIELTEGAVTTRLFHGTLIPGSVNLNEYDRYSMQRKGTFRCVSVLSTLRDTALTDVITACAGDMINLTGWNGTGTAAKIMSLRRFLARIMEVLNGSLDDNDIEVSGLAQDIQFSLDNSNWKDWSDLYFWCGTQNPSMLSAGWFEAAEWPSLFPSALEALVGIARSLLTVPVMYYDTGADRYRVRMLTRGHALSGSTALTMGTVLDSKVSTNIGRSIRYVEAIAGWSQAGTMPGYHAAYYSPADDNTTYTQPSIGIDLSFKVFFVAQSEAYNYILTLLSYTSGTPATSCVYTRLWNYKTGAWMSGSLYTFADAAKCMGYRLGSRRWGYTQTHAGIGPSNTTQDGLYLMKNFDIADEVPYTRHFYASEISRNPAEHSVEVVWEEI